MSKTGDDLKRVVHQAVRKDDPDQPQLEAVIGFTMIKARSDELKRRLRCIEKAIIRRTIDKPPATLKERTDFVGYFTDLYGGTSAWAEDFTISIQPQNKA